MSSPPRSNKVWTLVVITAAVAGLLGIGLQLNSPDITIEDYRLIGIDRVPESRFLARIGYFGNARWEDVPVEYTYVIWLTGEAEWTNRFYDTDLKLPKIWLEDENRNRVGRVFVKRTGDEDSKATNLGIGITAEDLESAASGYIVIARNKKEIARLPLANLAQMADLPERPVVESPVGSVVIKCSVYASRASLSFSSGNLRAGLADGDQGDFISVIGQASFLAMGDEDTNDVWALLMRGHNIVRVSLDNLPPVAEPMAVKISGRIVHGTWVWKTIHIDASLVAANASGQEEELTVPTQSHSFLGGSITLDGTSIRKLDAEFEWDLQDGDHQIDFSLDLSPLFTSDVAEFGTGAEKALVLVSPYTNTYYGPGISSTPGESYLDLFSVRGLIDACPHSAVGFDVDVYTFTPTGSSNFSVKLKPSF